jgi:Putative metallopeptidase
MAVNMRDFGLGILWAALGALLFAAGPVKAQQTEPAQSTLGQRIEAAAKAALNSPRLKGLTEQQRIDRVEFVAGNTLVLLSHELGHVLIAELHLPLLGREEDAADTYAALRLLAIGTSFPSTSLRKPRRVGSSMTDAIKRSLNGHCTTMSTISVRSAPIRSCA